MWLHDSHILLQKYICTDGEPVGIFCLSESRQESFLQFLLHIKVAQWIKALSRMQYVDYSLRP